MKHDMPSLAKITQPQPIKAYVRHRLFKILDENRRSCGTWVGGPAGCGKTTLVSSYVSQRDLSCIWYKIDRGDFDAASFFYYLRQAAIVSSTKTEPNIPLLTPEFSKEILVFSKRFFECMFKHLAIPFVIVFDNYQEIGTDTVLDKVLCQALSAVPRRSHLFILSRTSPPPSLARAVANNRLGVMHAQTLCLSLEETQAIVNLKGSWSWPKASIEQLHAKTEGWVAGITLILKQAENETIDPQLLCHLPNREMFDYFAEEIFKGLDTRMQTFLIKSAISPFITSDMAHRLCNEPEAEIILSKLHRDHFFTSRHIASPIYYQFHPLFREFLLCRGLKHMNAEYIRHIKENAAHMLTELGQIDYAIDLYLSAEAWQPAIDLLQDNILEIVLKGRHKTVAHWLGHLPEKFLDQIPLLLYYQATCRGFSAPSDSAPIYKRALDIFKAIKSEVGIAMSLEGIAESLASSFQYKSFNKWLPIIDSFYYRIGKRANPTIKAHLLSALLHVLVSLQPNRHDMASLEAEALALLGENIPVRPKFALFFNLISLRINTGLLDEASYFFNLFRDQFSTENLLPSIRHALYHLEAIYYWYGAEFNQCRKVVCDAMVHAESNGLLTAQSFLAGSGCAAELGLGNLKQAELWLAAIRARLPHLSITEKAWYYNFAVWLALVQEKPVELDSLSKLACQYAHDSGHAIFPPSAQFGRAIVLFTLNQVDQAAIYVADALNASRQNSFRRIEFGCYLLQAEIALAAGDDDQTVVTLKKAMAFGKRHNYWYLSFWRPKVMSNLCAKALELDVEVEYVRELIRKNALVPEPHGYGFCAWPWPVRIFTFGCFEVQVDDQPLTPKHSGQNKPLTLLKAIIAFGGRQVSEEKLSEALWPDADGDAAHVAFTTTLHRLRKLISHETAIILQGHQVSLNPSYCWVDTWRLQELLTQSQATERSSKEDAQNLFQSTELIFNIYRGQFLSDDDSPWLLGPRERMRTQVLRRIKTIASQCQAQKRWDLAISTYERCLELDPLVESFYLGLMQCYQQMERRADALAVYERCRKILGEVLMVCPCSEIEAIRKQLRS